MKDFWLLVVCYNFDLFPKTNIIYSFVLGFRTNLSAICQIGQVLRCFCQKKMRWLDGEKNRANFHIGSSYTSNQKGHWLIIHMVC